jgi:hypothetical protein
MLSLTIRSEGLEAIAGRNPEVAQHPGLIQKAQFSQSDALDVRRQFSAPAARPDQFRLGIGEASNHGQL